MTLRAAMAYKRLRAFINHRTQPQTPPLTLAARRIYILPTRSGLYFAALVCVMLAGALNYANSLGFVVTFMLTGLGLVSMHHTQRNLLRLRVDAVGAAPIFAGDTACFTLTLSNPSRLPRFAICAAPVAASADKAPVTIASGATASVSVHCPAARRGQLPCPRLRLSSRYPLGLFRSWSPLQLQAHALVYPRPAGDLPLPQHAGAGEQTARRQGDAEFSGQREYRRGDSPRHINWKASARSDTLIIAQHSDSHGDTLWLDAANLAHLPLEQRLAQLARWVIDADAAGLRYGLRLGRQPADCIAPGYGQQHRHACLRALALSP